jgi:hypothetical protein
VKSCKQTSIRKHIMTHFKTKFGTYPTLELAASFLGISIERAEKSVMANDGQIVLVKV